MKLIVLFIVTTILFSGCGSSKRAVVAKKAELPSWYINPQSSDAQNLYSIGEGQNREAAIADALSMMVSTLSVSISSQFNSKTVVKEGLSSSNEATYTNEIQSDVKKIRISHYELLNSKSVGYKRYIVLVKSNKQKLFNSMEKEVNDTFYNFKQKEISLSNANTIKKIKNYKEFQNDLINVKNTIEVMSSLKNNFDSKIYFQKISAIESKLQNALSSLTFSVKSNKEATNLKSTILKALSKKEINVTNASGKNHFTIFINSKIQKANAYGFTLAKSAIDITIKDYKGIIIGSNKLNITGQSTSGYANAKENVAFKLNTLIKKDGVEKIVGLAL